MAKHWERVAEGKEPAKKGARRGLERDWVVRRDQDNHFTEGLGDAEGLGHPYCRGIGRETHFIEGLGGRA